MKQRWIGMLLAMGMIATGCTTTPNIDTEDTIQVSTSFYPMYDFATKIGGDRVSVTNLVPVGMEPHDWEPSAKDLIALENADFLIYNGAGMEGWIDQVVSSLNNSNLNLIDASTHITLLEGEHHDDEKETEEHDAMDPHTWLSIRNAKLQMAAIRDAFVAHDPTNATYYQNNYDAYASKFDALDAKYQTELSNLTTRNMVVSHQAFGYLAHDYNLTQIAIEGLEAHSEPTAARMAELIAFVKSNGIKVIFFEELVDPKIATMIATETGATTEMLNPLEGLSKEDLASGKDYLSVMEQNLTQLLKALR